MTKFEGIPVEIAGQIASLMGRSDLARLTRCSRTFHRVFVGFMYSTLYINEALPKISEALIQHVRRFFFFSTKGHSSEVNSLLLKISEGGKLLNLQCHPSYGMHLASLPRVINASTSLVTLSIDVGVQKPKGYEEDNCAPNLSGSNINIQLPSLRQIRLGEIDYKVANLVTVYRILNAAPNLVDIDLDLKPEWRDDISGEDEPSFDPAEVPAEFGPIDNMQDLLSLTLFQPLARIPKIRSISLSCIDLEQLIPCFGGEGLEALNFRYCTNWDALKTHICSLDQRLRLRSFRVHTDVSQVEPINAILESLQPGLETLFIAVDRLTQEAVKSFRTNGTNNRLVYTIQQDSILKHSKSLHTLGLYFLQNTTDWDDYESEVFVPANNYLQWLRPIYKTCPLRELSITVKFCWLLDYGWSEIEVRGFKNLGLRNLEVLSLIPSSWSMACHLDGCDGSLQEWMVERAILQFLEAAFGYHSEPPALKYLLFGLRTENIEYEYTVQWRKNKSIVGEEVYEYNDEYEDLPDDYEGGEEEEWNVEEEEAEEMEEFSYPDRWFARMRRFRKGRARINEPREWFPYLQKLDFSSLIKKGNCEPFILYRTAYRESEYGDRPETLPAFF